jgi:hypothetical protein
MNFTKEIAKYLPCTKKEEVNVGKIVFKTIAITTAVLAFIPTVFVIKKGKGFDGYGLLSRVGYEKSTDENGKPHHNIIVTLIDLSRYGIDTEKKEQIEENENSISIEE